MNTVVGHRPTCAALGAFLGVLALTMSGSTASATFPGANGRIAFTGTHPDDPGSPEDIYSVLSSGNGLTQLTHSGVARDPSWSADGRRIAYLNGRIRRVNGRYRYPQVYVMDADGSNKTRVTSDRANEHSDPAFGPGGKRILYARSSTLEGASGAIISVRPDGSDPRVIVRASVYYQAVSPDGRWIAFTGIPNETNRYGLWLVHRDGTHLHRLAIPNRPAIFFAEPDWDPDGSRVLYRRCYDDRYTQCGGILVRRDGSNREDVSELDQVFAPSGERFAGVTHSPDPSATPTVDRCADIAVAHPSGSFRNVTHNCRRFYYTGARVYAEQPAWQPRPTD